jgi:hypothetical protein
MHGRGLIDLPFRIRSPSGFALADQVIYGIVEVVGIDIPPFSPPLPVTRLPK